MKLKVIIHQEEDGGYWAEVPALPGCVTEGDTMDELIDNVREAASLWLETAADIALRERAQQTTPSRIEEVAF